MDSEEKTTEDIARKEKSKNWRALRIKEDDYWNFQKIATDQRKNKSALFTLMVNAEMKKLGI